MLFNVWRKLFELFFQGMHLHQFFYSKRLIHYIKHIKRYLKKFSRAFFDIFTSGHTSGSPYTSFGFSIFTKYYLYTYFLLCIKFAASVLISFGDIKRTEYSPYSQTHMYIHTERPIFKNQRLRLMWTSKHVLRVKTRYWKF